MLLGVRATDAIIDTDRLKGRKLTYWHGMKITKESKEDIIDANVKTMAKKCRACIEIVEQKTREAVAVAKQKAEAAADPEAPVLIDEPPVASAEQLNLVFGLLHSVPEVADLDSIYKHQLFRELRIMHFATGQTVLLLQQPQQSIYSSQRPCHVHPFSRPRFVLISQSHLGNEINLVTIKPAIPSFHHPLFFTHSSLASYFVPMSASATVHQLCSA